MSTLIPNRQLSEIRKLTTTQLRLMRACEVFDGDESRDENYVYTHIPHNPYDSVVAESIRTNTERFGMKSNSIYPHWHKEEMPAEHDSPVDPYPNLTKARKARQEKHQKAAVAV